MADLKNTNIDDEEFLELPSGSTAQRPSNPETGMIRFNTDDNQIEGYDGSNWIPVGVTIRESVNLTDTMSTPDDTWVTGDTVSYTPFNNTPSQQSVTFPVRNGRQFRIRLYGGAGGQIGNPGNYGGRNNGGIYEADVNLSQFQNQNIYLRLGGAGQNSANFIDGSTGRPYGNAGQNGGGRGAGTRGPSGGGRSDLRSSTNAFSEILVASGGGGGYGNLGVSNNRVDGLDGRNGFTGSFPYDNGGGGGGYRGGNASNADDGSNGGSGSNYSNGTYTDSVRQNSRYTSGGGNSGPGYFEMTVLDADE